MKPYIGILIDSFWEAIGNKVLWALLIGWSLVLLALAPFGYISERNYELSSADIANRSQLVEKLAKGANGEGPKSARAIAQKLDPKFVLRLQSAAKRGTSALGAIRANEVATQLTLVVNARDLYSDEAFPGAIRRERLQALIETPSSDLAEEDVERLNRELLQLAFPAELNRSRGEQLWIGYAGFKIKDPLPVTRQQARQFIEPIFLGLIIKLGLGVLAVFVAIIVTSPMIPDTFSSGSLHLMLSKPISRVWLYLSKFLGGCIFVLVNITFVLCGLYLIAGLRFDMWNSGLLACIPLLVFVFVIFYSVSGLAALVWGNAIVSVVACLMFWLLCFSIGFIHEILRPAVEIFPQTTRIQMIDDHLTRITENGDFGVWNDEFSVWQPAIRTEYRGRRAKTVGPIYNAERNEVLIKSFPRSQFGGWDGRYRKIAVIDLEQNAGESAELTGDSPPPITRPDTGPTSVSEARDNPVWVSDPGPDLPQQLFDLVQVGETIVAVCRSGLFRLDWDQLETTEPSQKALFGIPVPWLSKNQFENIAEDYFLSANSHAAPTAAGTGLVVFRSGNVDHLELREGVFELINSVELEGDGTEAALVQMNAAYCVVARDGLPLEILDNELQALKQINLPREANVKQLAWVPSTNQLSIVTHAGDFLRLDCESGIVTEFDIPFMGECTCVTWINDSEVYLGVMPNRVYRVDLKTGQTLDAMVPKSTVLETVFGWAIKPLYTAIPKPAALDNAMGFLLSGNETQSLSILTKDLEAAQIEVEIWPPILSNLAFVAVMLGLSSIYIARKEF